jgi:hypothetical protein
MTHGYDRYADTLYHYNLYSEDVGLIWLELDQKYGLYAGFDHRADAHMLFKTVFLSSILNIHAKY